jgi:hypothetical protein
MYELEEEDLEGIYKNWQKKLHPDLVHSKSEVCFKEFLLVTKNFYYSTFCCLTTYKFSLPELEC